MGIVLAVKKKDTICIAADTMTVSGGSRKQTASYVDNSEKIIQCGSSYIGTTDHPTWQLTLETYVKGLKRKPQLSSEEEIFDALLKMHPVLKDDYFLAPGKDEDDPFESSRFESLIVNRHGIFKTYAMRSIQKFIHFAAIGSGASYAFGALYALYDRLSTAEKIAQAALHAVAELDDSTGLPWNFLHHKDTKMTTIAAVKKGKRLCLASDTLTTSGSRKEVAGQHVTKEGKIIQIGANYSGTSGEASWNLLLSHYFSKKKVAAWKTEREIFEVFTLLHEQLKKKYYLHSHKLSYLPFESAEFLVLMINRYGIFEIEYSRAVRKYSKFAAIGSGEEYALGAMESVYERIEDPEEIAKIGIEAGAHFDQATGLPMQTCSIDLSK